jgi:hypothetical protein
VITINLLPVNEPLFALPGLCSDFVNFTPPLSSLPPGELRSRAFALRRLNPKALALQWLLNPEKDKKFPERVLARLIQSEAHEPDVWLRDDYRQAFITLTLALKGNTMPFVVASYEMYGLHPDKVFPAIVARRKANLGREYRKFYDVNDNRLLSTLPDLFPSAKRHTTQKKKPLAVSGDGDVPQKTCAYGAIENTSSNSASELECRFDTGASWSTATKREARRTHTSELGHDATTAGVPAPAEISQACGKHNPIPQGVLLPNAGVEKSAPASPRKPVQSVRKVEKRRAA